MGNASDTVDVLIVGGGTSGGVAAKHFAENGLSVLCLEQGNWVNAGDLPGDKPEYELIGGKQWHPDPNQRQRSEDYPCENSDSDVIPWMYNGVGGSSILYAACWSRLLPSDFRVHSLDGVADDWPLSYEDVQPFYEQLDVERVHCCSHSLRSRPRIMASAALKAARAAGCSFSTPYIT